LTVRIENTSRGIEVADRAVLASSTWRRSLGLLNRHHLEPGEGLVLAPGGTIHMFFMRTAIDVVFTDRDGNVLKTSTNVKPWRVVLAPRHTRYTIELPVGALAASDTKRGDRLELNVA
jgi:uncharacterized membrane protein (UPF0127 family)